MKAKKENKTYRVTEAEKQRYLKAGYDIYSDDGILLEHSPLKKISYAEHERLLKAVWAEAELLRAENAELKAEVAALTEAAGAAQGKAKKKAGE